MVSTSVSRHHHHECGVGGAVREGCCSCARCACPPEQRTQQRVRRRTGAGRTQASYSKSYSYTGPVPSVAVKEWTRMRAIVGLADVGGERAQMVVSSWHGVRPDLCAKPAKTGAFVPSKFVCAAGGRDRREPISSCKLYCLSVLDYRTSSCGLGGKSGLPPAVQKATATAPWTLSTLERKGTRHHTCALRSPARESAYRHYVICTYIRDDDPAPWPETHTVIHLLAITLLYCVLELLIHILHPFDIASHAAGRPPERSASAHQQRGTTVPWDPLAARFARQPWC
jgi:hypothetical protein